MYETILIKAKPNPLRRLLDALPPAVARQKRRSIRAELEAIGKYQHYKQSVLERADWRFGDTHASVMYVLMKQLGLSLEFFAVATAEQQQKEIEQILLTYHS
jgi:hypothetical protein